jgi:hypothetical protein
MPDIDDTSVTNVKCRVRRWPDNISLALDTCFSMHYGVPSGQAHLHAMRDAPRVQMFSFGNVIGPITLPTVSVNCGLYATR